MAARVDYEDSFQLGELIDAARDAGIDATLGVDGDDRWMEVPDADADAAAAVAKSFRPSRKRVEYDAKVYGPKLLHELLSAGVDVVSLQSDDERVILIVSADADEKAIAAAIKAHDPTPPPDEDLPPEDPATAFLERLAAHVDGLPADQPLTAGALAQLISAAQG